MTEMAAAETTTPVPPQMPFPHTYDFRHACTAPHGVKHLRKRKHQEIQDQVDADLAQMPEDKPEEQPSAKRTKFQNNRVSGKNWKAVAPRMSSTGNPKLNTSWDDKMKAKAEAALYKGQKDEARAERREQLNTEKNRRKAVKERKAENVKKALAKTGQKITNNATLRRMMKSKKQRKQLVTA